VEERASETKDGQVSSLKREKKKGRERCEAYGKPEAGEQKRTEWGQTVPKNTRDGGRLDSERKGMTSAERTGMPGACAAK